MTPPREHAIDDRRPAHIQRAIALCNAKLGGKTKCERCRHRIATRITQDTALCAGCSPKNSVAEAARRLAAVTR